MVLTAWGAAVGVFAILFAFNARPPGLMLAVGLGAVFGLGPAAILLFFRRDHVSGAVTIDDRDGIRRRRNYASLSFDGGWTEWMDWPFDSISRCVVVPGESIGQSFDVLLIYSESSWEIVGIPNSVDVARLTKYLKAQGVTIEKGTSIPSRFTTPLGMALSGGISAAFVALLAIGLTVYGMNVVNKGPRNIPVARDNASPEGNPRQDLPPTNNDDGFGGFGASGAPAAPVIPAGIKGEQTFLAGGSGGTPFTRISPSGEPVIGLRYRLAEWEDRERVGEIEPLFNREPDPGSGEVLVARDGYAVGLIHVDAEEFVDALAIVFMRLTPEGRLDPSDSYKSDWIGTPTGKPVQTLGSTGAKVVGICGRGAAILDAVGLVLDKP